MKLLVGLHVRAFQLYFCSKASLLKLHTPYSNFFRRPGYNKKDPWLERSVDNVFGRGTLVEPYVWEIGQEPQETIVGFGVPPEYANSDERRRALLGPNGNCESCEGKWELLRKMSRYCMERQALMSKRRPPCDETVKAGHDISQPPYNTRDCPYDGGCIYVPYSKNNAYCTDQADCAKKGGQLTDCELAFRNYFCYLNFPRCDDENKSLPMCQSACINLMKACKYGYEMMRCGPSEFHNDYFGQAETPALDSEQGTYSVFYRDFFPGQVRHQTRRTCCNLPLANLLSSYLTVDTLH